MSLPTIPVDQIHPHPDNVRKDLGDLTELAQSIRAVGLLQPLVVMKSANGWTVIDGHRRLAAAKLAGAKALPVIAMRPGDIDAQLSTMLAAALHKSLEPLEQARAFARLRARGLTVADIARRTGYSTATVSARLVLVNLPVEVQDMVDAKTLSLAEATELGRQIRDQGSGSGHTSVPRPQRPRHLDTTHRLAAAVKDACGHREFRAVIGGVGCGQCWEHAIRIDEKSKARA